MRTKLLLGIGLCLNTGIGFAADFVGEAQMLKQIKYDVSTTVYENSVTGLDVQKVLTSNVKCNWHNNILRELCSDKKTNEKSIASLSPIKDSNKTCSNENLITRGFICSTSGKDFYIAYPNNKCPELGGIPTPSSNSNDCALTVKFHFVPDAKAGKFPAGFNITASAKNDSHIHLLTLITSYLASLNSEKEIKWMSNLLQETRLKRRIADSLPDSETVAQLWDQIKDENNFQHKQIGDAKELNVFINSQAAGDRTIRLHNISVDLSKKAFQCTNETYEINASNGTVSNEVKSILTCTYSDWCKLNDLRLCTQAQYLFLKANTKVAKDENSVQMFYNTLLNAQDAGLNKLQDMVRFASGMYYRTEENKNVATDGSQVLIQPQHMFPLSSKYSADSENMLGLPSPIILKPVAAK